MNLNMVLSAKQTVIIINHCCSTVWLFLQSFPFSEATAHGPGTFDGPRRYLEWTRPIDLFLQYQQYAESSGQEAAGFQTFLRVMRRLFKTHLKFRDKNEHAQCDICFKLRQRIRRAKTKPEKTSTTYAYSRHLLSQWLDRQLYWQLRALSRNFFSQALQFERRVQADLRTSMLAMIQDGMDQAKLRVPRFGYQQISKALEKIFRPALHLVATWAHGWKLRIAIGDEDLKKNSETSIELITLALCNLVEHTGKLPLSFHLQQDNCYREGKNRFVVNYMLLLTILGVFRTTSMGFLRTAHSHEDVDQCFGQISRLLMGKRCGTADEMVGLIADATMDPGSASSSLRASVVESFKIDQVSVWKNFVAQTGLKFKGLRRVHYFRFCLRQDLGADVLDNVAELEDWKRRYQPHPEDIFLVTKRWLADTEISRAIAVFPASKAKELRNGLHPPAGLAPRRTITEKVKNNIKKRIPPLRQKGEISRESADYLLQWSSGTLPQTPKPAAYSLLRYRYNESMDSDLYVPGAWTTPHRVNHFDLTLRECDDAAGSDDSSEDDEGAIDLGNGMGD